VLHAACPDCDIEMRDTRGGFGGCAATVSKGDRAVNVLPLVGKRLFHLSHTLRGTSLS